MKKKINLLTLAMFCILGISACCIKHEWIDATCIEPKICSKCEKTEGEALGHKWEEATCITPVKCLVCEETQGEALGHEWEEATCTTAKVCSVCKEIEGEALGHEWKKATCVKPATCKVCGEVEGEALEHEWIEATCTKASICSKCKTIKGEALGHEWIEATSIEPKTCSRCRETEGEPLGQIAKNTFNKMRTLTKKDCTINALGQYEYNGLPLLSDDCEWIDSRLNPKGTVEAGAVYRKLAMCLRGFAIGNAWEDYAPIILGYTPESRSEFAKLVDELSSFIVTAQPANNIRKKFQTINTVNVSEKNSKYTMVIFDLVKTAEELKISNEMMGYVLCGLYEGGATITFSENGCVIEYIDYWSN